MGNWLVNTAIYWDPIQTSQLSYHYKTKHANALSTLQDVLLPVSPVFLVQEPTVPVKLLSETCAVQVACSLPQKFGADGTKRSTSDKSKREYLECFYRLTEC